jgi:hypothetical protein
MPLQKIQFKPGINREGTSLANEGGWFASDKIRFRSGYPEKIGGWTVNTYNRFLGTCRSLWNWITLGQYNLLGVGTHLKFYIENGGTYNDITPIRLTTNNTTTFVAGYSQLGFTVSATQTFLIIDILDAPDFCAQGGLVRINEEQIQYGAVVGDRLVNCVRGVNGTTAVSHGPDNYVWSNSILVTDSTTSGVEIGDFVTFTGATTALNQGFPMTVTAINGTIIDWNFLVDYAVPTPVIQQNTPFTFTGGTIPSTVVLGTTYYCIDVSVVSGATYNFKISATPDGSPITLTGGSPITTFYGNFDNAFVITPAILNQEYQVYATPSNTVYAIAARQAVAGNVSVTNGGAPVWMGSTQTSNGGTATDAAYQINTGLDTVTVGTGWGAGPWNAGSISDAWAHGWGTGFTSGIALQLRLWNQVNFGQYLLFASRQGSMYVYDPTGGVGSETPVFNRGTLVTGTQMPSQINFFTVSDAARITICFGCTDFTAPLGTGDYDPMLIRWSAQESYTYWLPAATNQAGSVRLSHGSFIQTALQTRQEIIVWTDSAVYSMQYIGPPYIWRINLLADNISIMSENATCTAAGATYWMGVDKFYAYTGRVETLPCSVRQYVFNDLNKDQASQIFCGTNEGYNEVWWFYPSITGLDGTGTVSSPNRLIDRYVIFNHLDKVWYYGTLPRTSWLDSPLRASPMATTLDSLLVYHEQGTDDGTTNPPSAIYSYVQSSLFDIEDGDRYSFVWRMVPDVTFDGSTTGTPAYPSVNMSLIPKQNPGAPFNTAPDPSVTSTQSYASKYTYNVQEFTQIVYTRVRGRQLTFQISSDTRGSAWQLGVPTIDIRKDGRR